jgi:hypothetical protein
MIRYRHVWPLRPTAEDRLRMWPVSRRVNRTGGGDDPALIAEIAA